MPGITGIISRRPAAECLAVVHAMVGVMKHENACQSATQCFPSLGIYCGWVAFEKSLAAGAVHQNETADVVLIFSGDVFLDAEVGTALKQNGHVLDQAKASWLVHMYEEEGERFLRHLNGLFSGLLIDRQQGRAFLFNDRFGLERIYYHESDDAFYFASEAKALLRVLPRLRELDPAGLTDYLAFGCTLDWRTLFREIYVLPGGSNWAFAKGQCRRETYFSPAVWEAQPVLSVDEYESRFQQTFKRILPRYFDGASKIGIALTGGLDTRMIMACRPAEAGRQTTYTFSGNDRRTLDDTIAARIAGASGLEHNLLRLGPDFFSQFAALADKTVYLTDGCCGVAATHEIYFNRQARSLAPVRLTGNYGSEILRGISTFKPLPISPDLFHPDLQPAVTAKAGSLFAQKTSALSFAAFKEIPWNLFGPLAAGRSQVSFRTPYLDNELVALAYQAPTHAWKSPLPALHLIQANDRALSAIPTDRGFLGGNTGLGTLFRRAFAEATFKLDYYHNEGLPRVLAPLNPLFQCVASRLGIVGRHKSLHYAQWFRNELAGYLKAVLGTQQTSRVWNPVFLQRLVSGHLGGRNNFGLEINAVLTVEAVERQLFRELPRGL